MPEVKFSDIRNMQTELVKNASLFEDKNCPQLKEFLKLQLNENRGLGFSKHQSVRKQFKEVFGEIEKNWKLNNKNIVPRPCLKNKN